MENILNKKCNSFSNWLKREAKINNNNNFAHFSLIIIELLWWVYHVESVKCWMLNWYEKSMGGAVIYTVTT